MEATGARRRALGALVAGESLALVGEQVLLVVLTLVALDQGGGGAVAVVLAAASVPRGVLLPFGGVVADRLGASRVLAPAAFARAAVLVALALVAVAGTPPVAVLATFAAVAGIADAVWTPASLAVLPEAVPAPRLERANALVQGAEAVGDVAGPALGAFLFAAVGAPGALAVLAATAVGAALALASFSRTLRRLGPVPVAQRGEADDDDAVPDPGTLLAGLRYAARDPFLRALLGLLVALNLLAVGPIVVGGAVLADERLGGDAGFGALLTAFGVGGPIGLVLAGARTPRRPGLLLAVATVQLGVGVAALGVAQGLAAALPIAVAMGAGYGWLAVVAISNLQRETPPAMRGRVMGLVAFCAIALDPLSYALAGALLPAGLTALFAVCGAGIVLAGAIAAATPSVRTLRAPTSTVA